VNPLPSIVGRLITGVCTSSKLIENPWKPFVMMSLGAVPALSMRIINLNGALFKVRNYGITFV
jgi:hypothetical protein